MKNKGCLTTILKLIAIILFFPLAIVWEIIYLIIQSYKGGKFDNITDKTNVLIKKYTLKFQRKILIEIFFHLNFLQLHLYFSWQLVYLQNLVNQ